MIGSLLYCCCKPVRIATCLDLSTVDQPSRVVTLLLCFLDVVWVVRFHRVHVSYFKKLCSNFVINRNHLWTGRECILGLRPDWVKCFPNRCLVVNRVRYGAYPLTQWAPSRLKKI